MAAVLSSSSTALITGGSSGIGLAVAQMLRQKHGMKLAIVDNNAETLAYAKKTLAGSGPAGATSDTETYQMDVSKPEQWAELKTKVSKRFGSVDLLMLNAGIALKGEWKDAGYFTKVLETNLLGQIYGINTFLPTMQTQSAKRPAAIVMTGSKQGITNPPGNPAYNASKSAVKSLAEHLSYDLAKSHPNISVHLLVPGWTFTGISGYSPIAERADIESKKPAGAWWPEQVADRLEEGLKKGRDGFWIICPDNDVTESTDRKRMMWTAGDAVEGRPPMSRWRDEWKEKAQEWMDKQNL